MASRFVRKVLRGIIAIVLLAAMVAQSSPALAYAEYEEGDDIQVEASDVDELVTDEPGGPDVVIEGEGSGMPEDVPQMWDVPEEQVEETSDVDTPQVTEDETWSEASDVQQETSLATQAADAPKLSGRSKADGGKWSGKRRGEKLRLGATGRRLKLEAFRLYRPKCGASGSIEYCAHVQNRGWTAWRRDGKAAGTVGRGLRLEAVKVRLTGELKKTYDVWYRVHAEGFGWLAWARNGRAAGSQGYSRRVDAIQVGLAERGAGCPWANGKAEVAFVKGKSIYKAGLKKVSGDVKFDMLLDEFVKNNCGTGKKALKRAYGIIASYPYRYAYDNPKPKDNWKIWSKSFAKDMYANRSGNCFRYASLMCWVARRLGYDAKAVSGYVYTSTHEPTPHGWVEVRKGGKTYVIDPQMYNRYRDKNWFMVTYTKAPIKYLKHK